MNQTKSLHNRLISMIFISFFTVLIAICSWISLPFPVPFTLQTFAIFLTLALLGGKHGTISIILYLLLGIIGIPVFSGFKGGIGVLFGTTGGYILGFLLSGLIYWLITKLFGTKRLVKAVSMLAGLLCCYLFGTIWFIYLYTKNTEAIGILTALGWCVFPFIIPDLCKIALALGLDAILAKHLPKELQIKKSSTSK